LFPARSAQQFAQALEVGDEGAVGGIALGVGPQGALDAMIGHFAPAQGDEGLEQLEGLVVGRLPFQVAAVYLDAEAAEGMDAHGHWPGRQQVGIFRHGQSRRV